MEKDNSNKISDSTRAPFSRPSKFKINWGTGIVIAFTLFISFILYFIIKVQSNSKYDNELVVEEYYKKDAKFGEEMVKIQNAQDLKQQPKIKYSPIGITLFFPEDLVLKGIKGKISFYRPSDKKFDFEVPISITSSSVNIPKTKLLFGRWDISMEWQYEGKQYLTKEVVYIE